MIDSKLSALEKQGRVTKEQSNQIRKLLPRKVSPFPSFGEHVHLVEAPEEAISLAQKGHYTLLDLVKNPKNPDEYFFVLTLQGSQKTKKRFGNARTWLLFGIAIGVLLSSLFQMTFNTSSSTKETKAKSSIIFYEPPTTTKTQQ